MKKGLPHLCTFSFDFKQLKTYIYIMMSAIEDEEAQKHGVVLLLYFLGDLRFDHEPSAEVVSEHVRAPTWLPFRYAAIHTCASTAPLRALFRLMMVLATPQNRSVTRNHEGAYVQLWVCGLTSISRLS